MYHWFPSLRYFFFLPSKHQHYLSSIFWLLKIASSLELLLFGTQGLQQASIDYPFIDSKENTCTFAWLKCGLLSAALWQSWWKPTKKSREIIRSHPTNVTLTGSLICSKTMFTSANSQTQYFIIFMTGNNQRLERAGEFDRRSKRLCSNASALRTFHLIKRMLATDVPCMRSNLSPAIITLFI